MKTKYFFIIILCVLNSCKSSKISKEEFILKAKYKKQNLMADDVIEDKDKAIKLGIVFIQFMDYESKLGFDEYLSIDAILLDDIVWKITMIKEFIYKNYVSENDTKSTNTINVYIRKKDGALLYYKDDIKQ